FIPALANTFAKRVAEIPVTHEARAEGSSKYNILRLATLSLNLITGFSLVPIQAISLTGFLVFFLSAAFAFVLLAHRVIYGPQQCENPHASSSPIRRWAMRACRRCSR